MLQRSGSITLARSRELVDIMAAVASEVRLARFLIQHSRRMADCGQSPLRFLLRMGRRELSSLLGVAHETVSRSFTTLSALDLIRVSVREVEILDMDRLGAFARSTRRPMDAPMLVRTRTPADRTPTQRRHAPSRSLAA
jgi:CRP/FNR family transcriptional regulator